MNKPPKTPYVRVPVKKEHVKLIEDALQTSKGDTFRIDTMESAIGALIMGNAFGWRVLYLCHTHSTLHKYCKLLQISSFKDECPEVGPYAMRSNGFRYAQNLKDFWACIMGEQKMERPERVAFDSA